MGTNSRLQTQIWSQVSTLWKLCKVYRKWIWIILRSHFFDTVFERKCSKRKQEDTFFECYGNEGYACKKGKQPQQRQQVSKSNKVSTSQQTIEKEQASTVTAPIDSKCVCCKQIHRLVTCLQFAKMSQEEQHKFLKEHRLCYGCLEQGPRSKYCKQRETCEHCGKHHPTVMCGNFKINNSLNANSFQHNCLWVR